VSSVHVLPVGDLIEHEADDECICGPTAMFIDGEHLSGWVMAHASLDGRELKEKQ
jgi:hypothetical protein